MDNIQTIKIVPTIITPRQVNTRKGPATVFDIQTQSGQKFSCWDEVYVGTLLLNQEVEIKYSTVQNGQYTNMTILSPNSRVSQTNDLVDKLKKIWDKMEANHQEIMGKLNQITNTPATGTGNPTSTPISINDIPDMTLDDGKEPTNIDDIPF